ncbi:MAG: hypothetical protein R3F55_11660 [Alphaproteobacteria bacterium]
MSTFNIGEVFSESLRFLFRQLRAMAVLAVVPYGLLVGALILIDYATAEHMARFQADMAAFQDYLAQTGPDPDIEVAIQGLVISLPSGHSLDFGPVLLVNLISVLALLIVPLPFKVAWLRYSLLGPQAEPVRPGYRFGPRELRFLGYTLGVAALMAAILMLFAGIGGVIGGAAAALFLLGGIGLALWIGARLYFVFPPTAMGLAGGLGRAWQESRGQAFKLLVLTLIVGLVFLVPTLLLGMVLASVPLVGTVLMLAVQAVADAALWTALGFAYWKTTGIPGPGGRLGAKAST